MTSLPIYWPGNLDFSTLGSDNAELPWQRVLIERCHTIEPLDTLSQDDAGTDPLVAIDRLAVIQPRGLSPADNVALDDWVRSGGKLLLMLDPVLSGEYALPLGDPARPVDTALIPPVVERWGMEISVVAHDEWDDGITSAQWGPRTVTIIHGGRISKANGDGAPCELYADNVIAHCQIGKGTVTLVADAAVVEHQEAGGGEDPTLTYLLDFAFR
ncbi:hypothetical protein FGU71_01765 [Erythrobacter insulae]|uniref:DUF4350 domain-containing protein n=1 Tax=Erythrobacter insulae TaxID=2584124 RepID=A0A547P9C2_9SPHN|nr:hypothetical protein [Erythrobacter insulae]TRD10716.1 hypothetical protein FGU71_01765 [Erythrobacter insulae]